VSFAAITPCVASQRVFIVYFVMTQYGNFRMHPRMGHRLLYEGVKDITSKTSNVSQILGILNNVLKPNLVQRQFRMKVPNILLTPSL
jgi:hypothetical protein